MSRVRVNMRQLLQFAKLEKDLAKRVTEDIEKAVLVTTMETHAEVVQNQPVFKGQLNNSTRFKAPITRGRGFIKTVSGEIFLVGNAALYGNVQDLGRTPGATMPPHAPIRRWVALKAARGQFKLPRARTKRQAIDRAAFLVRRKIHRDPAPGLKFFEKAEAGALLRLNRRVDDISDKFGRLLGGSL